MRDIKSERKETASNPVLIIECATVRLLSIWEDTTQGGLLISFSWLCYSGWIINYDFWNHSRLLTSKYQSSWNLQMSDSAGADPRLSGGFLKKTDSNTAFYSRSTFSALAGTRLEKKISLHGTSELFIGREGHAATTVLGRCLNARAKGQSVSLRWYSFHWMHWNCLSTVSSFAFN